MNAGAYDGEISQIIESAEILSKDGSRVLSLKKEELDLSYRHSILQKTGDVLLKATFLLEKGDRGSDRRQDQGAHRKTNVKAASELSQRWELFQAAPQPFCGKAHPGCGTAGSVRGRRTGLAASRGIYHQYRRGDGEGYHRSDGDRSRHRVRGIRGHAGARSKNHRRITVSGTISFIIRPSYSHDLFPRKRFHRR